MSIEYKVNKRIKSTEEIEETLVFKRKINAYCLETSSTLVQMKVINKEEYFRYLAGEIHHIFPDFDSNKHYVDLNTYNQEQLGLNDLPISLYEYKEINHTDIPYGTFIFELNPHYGVVLKRIELKTDQYINLHSKFNLIEDFHNFRDSKETYKKAVGRARKGLIFYGPPGNGKCLGKDTPVLMYDGSIKKVQDIVVGDVLMGDDSTPRNVLSTCTGREEMFKVIPTKGDPYIVNKSHILSLKKNQNGNSKIIDISVSDWLNSSKETQIKYKGYRVGVEFKETKLPIDPYFLGLWLGDGTARDSSITTSDKEIVKYLENLATSYELNLVLTQNCGKANTYRLTRGHIKGYGRSHNPILTCLQKLNVIQNKHIPFNYKINNRENRLELLAGLLDSDGSLNCNGFDFISKEKHISDDVIYLCRSLGLAAYMNVCEKRDQNGSKGTYYRVCISGYTNEIPTKILHKQAKERQQIKDVLITGITLESQGENDYYGFTLDGNHRFLLGDFTVTHNTMQVSCLSQLAEKEKFRVFFITKGYSLQDLIPFKKIFDKEDTVFVIEELTERAGEGAATEELLSFMDGEMSWDNSYIIATTNYPESLPWNIIDRPSRFKVKLEFPNPNLEERIVYLTQMNISKEQIEEAAKATEGLSLDYLKNITLDSFIENKSIIEIMKEYKNDKAKVANKFKNGKLGI